MVVNIESYMGSHVIFNLLNNLGKSNKMRGLLRISSHFDNTFFKFKNVRQMLDLMHHMTFKIF